MDKTPSDLELYYFDECPYCQMVMQAIDKNGIRVKYCNIRQDSSHYEYLLEKTGRTTVPCLFIDGDPLFESADIIKWIEDNLPNLLKV